METKKTLKNLTTAEGSTASSHLSTVALITEKQISIVITEAKDYPIPKRKDKGKWCHQSLEEEQGKETDKGDSPCHTITVCLVPPS